MKRPDVLGKCAIIATTMIVVAFVAGCSSGGGTDTNQPDPYQSQSEPVNCGSNPVLTHAMSLLRTAQQSTIPWTGPTSGPKAQPNRTIVYIAQDMSNGGVLGVSKGVQNAAAAIGWKVTVIDGRGTVAGRVAAIGQAVALHADGIILGSVDSEEEKAAINQAAAAGVKIVGWHSAPTAGPVPGTPIFTNITTNAADVAAVSAADALQITNCKAGAVIFWQSGDTIGISKAETMRSIVQACTTCKLLDYVNTPLADTATRMAGETNSLRQQFGTKWTVGLGINDLYFDFASPALTAAGIGPSSPPQFISAGDGSIAAFNRIRSGYYQRATVAEPLNEAGWQAIDELNRAFAGAAPSGYVSPVHIVTKANINTNGGPQNIYDPNNDYKSHYEQIWKG